MASMLVIRKPQMDAMEQARWLEFEHLARRHCWICHPDMCEALGEEGVRSYVTVGLRHARGYGFDSASDLLRYLDLMLTIGPDFAERSWAEEILKQTQYHASSRLDVLMQAALRELGQDAPRAEVPDASATAGLELPDASWPEPEPQPLPPAPVLQPTDQTTAPPPPPDSYRRDPHYDW